MTVKHGRRLRVCAEAFMLLLLCTACGRELKNGVHHLAGRRVLVLHDEPPSRVQLPADTSYLEYVFKGYDLVDVAELDPTIRVDLKYADTLNFTGRGFYDGLRKAYMTCDLAIRLCNAQTYLKQIDTSLCLLILDAARPLHIQQMMWDSLEMDAREKTRYLSPPGVTSLHNYGCAVDLTIFNLESQQPLNMGTGFDTFSALSQPAFEQKFAASGELPEEALYNRRLLRHVMTRAGLKGIGTEWWHFSLCGQGEAAARFRLIR